MKIQETLINFGIAANAVACRAGQSIKNAMPRVAHHFGTRSNGHSAAPDAVPPSRLKQFLNAFRGKSNEPIDLKITVSVVKTIESQKVRRDSIDRNAVTTQDVVYPEIDTHTLVDPIVTHPQPGIQGIFEHPAYEIRMFGYELAQWMDPDFKPGREPSPAVMETAKYLYCSLPGNESKMISQFISSRGEPLKEPGISRLLSSLNQKQDAGEYHETMDEESSLASELNKRTVHQEPTATRDSSNNANTTRTDSGIELGVSTEAVPNSLTVTGAPVSAEPGLTDHQKLDRLKQYASLLAELRADEVQPQVVSEDMAIVDDLIEAENALTPELNLSRFHDLDTLGDWLQEKVDAGEDFHQRAFVTTYIDRDIANPHHFYADIRCKDGQLSILVIDGLESDAIEDIKEILPGAWPEASIVNFGLSIQNTYFECMNLALSHAKKSRDHDQECMNLHDKACALGNDVHESKEIGFTLPPVFYKHATAVHHLTRLENDRPELDLRNVPINPNSKNMKKTIFEHQDALLKTRTIVIKKAYDGQPVYDEITYSTSLEHRRERFVARAIEYFEKKIAAQAQ